MPGQHRSSIQPFIVILFTVIGLLPLVVGSLVLIDGARRTHREVVGIHLGEMADYAQLALRDYLVGAMESVSALTTVPSIRSATEESNQRLLTPQEILQVDVDWADLTVETSSVLREVLQNPTSRFLREYSRQRAAVIEMILTDSRGRLVAATNKTSDFNQKDERWWRHAYRESVGGSFVSDLRFDDSVEAFVVDIAQPVMRADREEAIGVLKVSIHSSHILSVVNSVEVGRDGHAALVRNDDGIILVSRPFFIDDEKVYPYIDDMRAGLESPRQFVEAGEGEDRILLGLPGSRFRDSFPTLNWTLVAQQGYSEMLLPFYRINTRFFYIILFVVLLVVACSLLYSKLLTRAPVETDPHLERL
jgi:hypothetical protein